MTGTCAARIAFTILRIEEPSPPGVSITITTAAAPSRSPREIASVMKSCVTGLTSFSNWTARTRGAAAAALPASARAASVASEARKPRRRRAFTAVRILLRKGPAPWARRGRAALCKQPARMRILRIALLCLLLFPALARAEPATITSRGVPRPGERALAAATPSRFDLVGLHWQGPGTVSFRTRSLDGRWSPWRQAAPEAEDLPDARSPEAAPRRGRGGRPPGGAG